MEHRWKESQDKPGLPMTPMIDCVFQLLIFFIFTIRPEDIVARLDVLRPMPDPIPGRHERPPDMVRIGILFDGFTLQDKVVSPEALERRLGQIARLERGQTVLINCAADSRHEQLVRVLDLCAKFELKNLSVFSL